MNPFDTVKQFEQTVADYAGSRYAVAVDTCTAAIFLCCKYLNVTEVTLPSRTFMSVPCSVIHAGGSVVFSDSYTWKGSYFLTPYPIVDSACRFRSSMHIRNTYCCLSFQARKHIPIGRGGMILHDDSEADKWFRLARFNGRPESPMNEGMPTMLGWCMYMEPERAARGLHLMMYAKPSYPDLQIEYPDLKALKLYDSPQR